MKLITPQAILFDWDNTLVDTWPIIHQAFVDLFEEFGREPWTFEEVKERVGLSMREAFPILFGDEAEMAGKAYLGHYLRLHLEHLKVLENAENSLRWLKTVDMPIGLVSNKRGDTLRTEIEHLGWGHYFSAVVGAGDVERDKPDVAPFNFALEQLGLEESTPVWYIGDSVVDLELCANSGALPVLYGDAKTTASKDGTGSYKDYSYAALARNHDELLGLFKKQLAFAV